MAVLENRKYECFCQEYLVDLNQTQAAIRAGYSPRSAGQTASALMKKPKVRARVDELMAERSRRTGVNQDRVVRELARIGFVKLTDLIDLETGRIRPDASEDDLAALAGYRARRIPTEAGMGLEVEARLADKGRALELLGKHLGMYTDRTEIRAAERVVVVDDLREEGRRDRPPLLPGGARVLERAPGHPRPRAHALLAQRGPRLDQVQLHQPGDRPGDHARRGAGVMSNAAVFRRYGNTLGESVFSQMLWAVEALGSPPAGSRRAAPCGSPTRPRASASSSAAWTTRRRSSPSRSPAGT